MPEMIVQTAGRDALGEFSPEFAITTMTFCSARIGTTKTLM